MATMIETKHTPGPWELAPNRDREGAFRVNRDGYAVALVPLRGSSPASPQYHQQDGNARLIAAAPELRSTIQAVLHQMQHGEASDIIDNDSDNYSEADARRDLKWCREQLAAALKSI